MVLTDVQASAINLLRTYRCLRIGQIEKLLAIQFGQFGKDIIFAEGRQITRLPIFYRHLIRRIEPDMLAIAHAQPNDALLSAIDVMLEFDGNGIEFFNIGKPPFQLTFLRGSKEGPQRAYYIAMAKKGSERQITQQALDTYKGQDNVVIFVLEDIQQADAIHFPHQHYHALYKNGKVDFFKGVPCEV
jgi:hypothetical protein